MQFHHIAGAAYRALTARKDGPSLYDVCDPLLLNCGRGDAHIAKLYRRCGVHLLRSFCCNGFIPTYAAFNLIGDPDMGGRELLMALTGLNSRDYKNSTLLFNLARIFLARSPAC